MAKAVNLKPNYKLLNPNFDGYKLSSDADVTVYSADVHEDLEKKKPSSNVYLQTRLEALHNHLFCDPFHPSHVYYFSDRGHLVKHNFCGDTKLSGGEVVWQAEFGRSDDGGGGGGVEDGGQYYATLQFPSSELALVSNGQGSLHILETADRSSTQSWLESFETCVESGILVHALLREGSGHQRYLHCLMLSVATPKNVVDNPQYVITDETLEKTETSAVHLIHWLVLAYNGATWEVNRKRTIVGEGTLEYCSLDEAASGVLVLCHRNYSFVFDSLNPVTKPEPSSGSAKDSAPKFLYMQNDDDVTVWVNVESATKKDLQVKITVNKLSVHVQNTTLVEGSFMHPVEADSSTWTLSDGKLEITLPKATSGVNWQHLFDSEDDACGEELINPQMVDEVNRRLAHLTSDKWNADPDQDKQVYNPGQLEACDEASEDLLLLRADGDLHSISYLSHLGPTQHLFNSQKEGSAKAFCLRHDVDGVLWQPEGETFTHCATFNAFGYVKASKTMAKYTCAAPDSSYVAVADVKSHIYLFFQPEAFGGELRNRKSGKRVNSVARQVVISMKTHDEIMGLVASPSVLFVLTPKTVYTYYLRSS